MLRWSFKHYIAALTAVTAALVIPSMVGAQSAHGAQRSMQKYYPPLMENWQISGPQKTSGNASRFGLGMHYPGFVGHVYRAIGNKDIIPAMRVQLILPSGMTLLNSGSYKSRFKILYYWSTYHQKVPKIDTHWQMMKGVPTWTVLKVSEGIFPVAGFWVSGQPQQCFNATARGMQYKKIKRGKRRVRILVPIPHAPVQSAQACLPGTPPPTTTTG